jgi:hypothetical protein
VENHLALPEYAQQQKVLNCRLMGDRRLNVMSLWKSVALSTVAVAALAFAKPASAQVVIGVGVAPVCPYGYFDYSPYDCAPYGYYGPDWFDGGLFIGAGPWFHGRAGFHGHVDNRYDPRHGYHGPSPERGAQAFNHFQGNEAHDGTGHVVASPNHSGAGEHALPGFHGGGGGHGGGGHR